MEAHKLQVKVFAARPDGVTAETFIPIFHSWIKNHVLDELLIDVANYAHVPKGPGVVLIGNDADYFVDEGEGRFGLLYSRKRSAPPPTERLADAFRHALHAAILLQKEGALAGTLRFSPTELSLRINDRLAAPNTDQTFATLQPELAALAGKLFDGAYQLKRTGDPRSLFTVALTSTESTDPDPPSLDTLLARLA